jgi:hypothetical protein
MATTLKIKNSVTAAGTPTTLAQGELAVNVTDKKMWVGNAATTPVQIVGTGSGGGGAAGSNTQVQYNSSGALAGSANMVFDGTTLTTLNSAYTGTLTGGTGIVNIGSGQFYKDTSGNIGIGSTSPTAIFGLTAQLGNGSFQSTLSLIGSGAGQIGDVYLAGIADSALLFSRASTPLVFGTNNTEQVRITSAGLVGIGTSSPTTKLSVLTSTSNAGINVTDNVVNTIIYNIGGVSSAIGTSTSHALQLYTNNTAKVTVDTAGNTGIGTASPAVPLAVYNASTPAIHIQNSTSGVAATDGLQVALTGSTGYLYNLENGGLLFGTNSTERMRIAATGNLLVGTTTNNASGGVIQVSNGITFPATQSPSSDANTLDDYEEGTWTPAASTNITGSSGAGIYTKIGRMVYCSGNLSVTAISGDFIITGLPFTNSNNAFYTLSIPYFPANVSILSSTGTQVNPNATTISFFTTGTTFSGAAQTCYFAFWYMV